MASTVPGSAARPVAHLFSFSNALYIVANGTPSSGQPPPLGPSQLTSHCRTGSLWPRDAWSSQHPLHRPSRRVSLLTCNQPYKGKVASSTMALGWQVVQPPTMVRLLSTVIFGDIRLSSCSIPQPQPGCSGRGEAQLTHGVTRSPGAETGGSHAGMGEQELRGHSPELGWLNLPGHLLRQPQDFLFFAFSLPEGPQTRP